MGDTPLQSPGQDPFEKIQAFHKRLNRDLLAGAHVAQQDVTEFIAFALERSPRINSIKHQEEVQYLLQLWGSYLTSQGAAIPDAVKDRFQSRAIRSPASGGREDRVNRGISIHIGVNQPAGRHPLPPSRYSEAIAWRMAGLANQAGYGSVTSIRGAAASRSAVHNLLTGAASTLTAGDALFVSFSGHSWRERSPDPDSRTGIDEGWLLSDGVLLDERLVGYWRLFAPGVRILIVTDSSYGYQPGRDDVEYGAGSLHPAFRSGMPAPRIRGAPATVEHTRPCIAEPPRDPRGIRASVLVLSACRDEQVARDGLFSRHLLDLWDDGNFHGSFCDLYRRVRDAVLMEVPNQEPQILMLGAADVGFSLETAFHLGGRPARQGITYR
jgi:hypothetical protein